MNQIPKKIGNLNNVIGYTYNEKNYILLNHIDTKYNFTKSYALVSYNIINDYHNESLLQVISFIKNLHMNNLDELNYEMDNKEKEHIYINDSCNLCTFIKNKNNLENIYYYPQFIIEYTKE